MLNIIKWIFGIIGLWLIMTTAFFLISVILLGRADKKLGIIYRERYDNKHKENK